MYVSTFSLLLLCSFSSSSRVCNTYPSILLVVSNAYLFITYAFVVLWFLFILLHFLQIGLFFFYYASPLSLVSFNSGVLFCLSHLFS